MAFDGDGDANSWYYEMPEMGFNYRASDIHCALGLSQLKKLDHRVRQRRHLVALYDELFSPLSPRLQPIARTAYARPAWHLYSVLIDFETIGLTRQNFMARLHKQGIGSQVHYIPVHRQPYYQDLYGETNLPGADAYYGKTLSLPLFPQMTDDDVTRIVDAVTQIIQ